MAVPLPPLLAPPPVPDPLGALHDAIRRCTACDLCLTRTRAVPGEGSRRPGFVVVGEAPGEAEDLSGRPFVGRSGRLLRTLVAEAGVAPGDWFIANTNRCRPPANRPPTPAERRACVPYLLGELALLAPHTIVLLGRTAALGLLGPGANLPMATLRGVWPGEVPGALQTGGPPPRIVVTYHPAAALRNPQWRSGLVADLALAARGMA